jgi:hypothetical protein
MRLFRLILFRYHTTNGGIQHIVVAYLFPADLMGGAERA